MSANWISKLGRGLARIFSWQMPAGCVDYLDRDAERMAAGSGAHPDALPAPLVTGRAATGSLRGTALLAGLAGYGFSMAMMVRAEAGP